MKTLSIISLLAFLTLKASAIDDRIPFNVKVQITVTEQNPNTNTTATTITVPAFTKSAITTKSLLTVIAQDEFTLGDYGSATFPTGSKIVYLSDPFDFGSSAYVVEDKDGNVLVNISNLMTFAPENGVTLISYVQVIDGIFKTFSWNYVGIVSFDDTGVTGGTTKFSFSYLVNTTMKQMQSNKGVISESAVAKLGAATGTATLDGVPAIVTVPAQTLTGKVSLGI